MGTLMLLGGSHCQFNAAKTAKAMGHRVMLADYLACPPAAEACDEHVSVSTFDADACIREAKKRKVDGVFTAGTDQPVLTAAKVARALGLPSPISVETALMATNKRAMKTAFLRGGVPCAPFAYLRAGQGPETLAALRTPLVIKPLDSQGQRGVFRVNNPQEAAARLAETLAFSREDTALVESYYPSSEVTLSCWARDGRVYPLTLTDRQLIDDPLHIGVCAAHRYPSVFTAQTGEILRLARLVVLALEVERGPLYIQFLIGERGVIVNEASCRVGGAFEDVFIPWLTGFDILRAAIQNAMGLDEGEAALAALRPAEPRSQVSVQMIFCRPGVAAMVTPVGELLALPGALAAGYNIPQGGTIPAVENATARFGHCVLATRNGDMDGLVRALYRRFQVLDADGNNLVIPRTYDGAITA
jgi:biotin carboxylase